MKSKPTSGLPRCLCNFLFLPFAALIKVALFIVPVTLMHFLGMTLICLFFLPLAAFRCYLTVGQNDAWTVPVKLVLWILALPIFLVMWPTMVALFSLLGGLVFSIAWTVFQTMTEPRGLCTTGRIMQMSVEHVRQYYEFNRYHFFARLAAMASSEEEDPTPPACILFLVGIVTGLVGMVVDSVGIMLLLVISYVPLVVRSYINLITKPHDHGFPSFARVWWSVPLYLVVLLTLPALVALLIPVGFLFGFAVGIWTGVYPVRKRDSLAGFRQIGYELYRFDFVVNQTVWGRQEPPSYVRCCFCQGGGNRSDSLTPKPRLHGRGAGAGVDVTSASSSGDLEAGDGQAGGAGAGAGASSSSCCPCGIRPDDSSDQPVEEAPKDAGKPDDVPATAEELTPAAEEAAPATDAVVGVEEVKVDDVEPPTAAEDVTAGAASPTVDDAAGSGAGAGAGAGAEAPSESSPDATGSTAEAGSSTPTAEGAEAEAEAKAEAEAEGGVPEAEAEATVSESATTPVAASDEPAEPASPAEATTTTAAAIAAAAAPESAEGDQATAAVADSGDAIASPPPAISTPTADAAPEPSSPKAHAVPATTEFTPSGEPLKPIVSPDQPDEWVEMTTDEDAVYYVNMARGQVLHSDPNVPAESS